MILFFKAKFWRMHLLIHLHNVYCWKVSVSLGNVQKYSKQFSSTLNISTSLLACHKFSPRTISRESIVTQFFVYNFIYLHFQISFLIWNYRISKTFNSVWTFSRRHNDYRTHLSAVGWIIVNKKHNNFNSSGRFAFSICKI